MIFHMDLIYHWTITTKKINHRFSRIKIYLKVYLFGMIYSYIAFITYCVDCCVSTESMCMYFLHEWEDFVFYSVRNLILTWLLYLTHFISVINFELMCLCCQKKYFLIRYCWCSWCWCWARSWPYIKIVLHYFNCTTIVVFFLLCWSILILFTMFLNENNQVKEDLRVFVLLW